MFKLNQILKNVTHKLNLGKPLTAFEQKIVNLEKQQQSQHKKQEKKFKETHELLYMIETSKKPVPVWRFTGWDYGKKYTGQKLRKIRSRQAEALKKEHPELVKNCVELWKYPANFKTTKVSRQQRRAAERKALKQGAKV